MKGSDTYIFKIYSPDDEGSEERMDSFPSGLRTPNRLEPGSANSSYGNIFGLGERRKRLR